ncbi:hypothetical protein HY969_03395 [Candidatus Kaiserbacteria bacterium]|nr:hypothetical protein [Candidatus Kaiserbacteria bacterium]
MKAIAVAYLGIFIAFTAMPAVTSAQEMYQDDSSVLRSEIRLALLADARSSELTDEEVAMLVESLAGEAEAQGIAQEFLPERAQTMRADAIANWWENLSEPMLYGIVLVALALAMVLMKRIIDSHHHAARPPDTPAAV